MMTSRPPRKFTDAAQTEITPEWREWYAAQRDENLDEMMDTVAAMGNRPENRWPEHHDKDLGTGAWILVVEEPHTEIQRRFRIPTPSLWWARPEESRPGSFNLGSKRFPKIVPGMYRAVIETPGGTLWLHPHEYVICQNPVPLITDPDCTIHPLGGRPALDEEKEAQLFYLQSRGWTYQDSILQIMDGLDMRDWGWVEFPEYARAAYEGVGRAVALR